MDEPDASLTSFLRTFSEGHREGTSFIRRPRCRFEMVTARTCEYRLRQIVLESQRMRYSNEQVSGSSNSFFDSACEEKPEGKALSTAMAWMQFAIGSLSALIKSIDNKE